MADPVQATSWWKDLWDVLQPTFTAILIALGAWIVALLRSAAAKRNLEASKTEAMMSAVVTTATKVEEVHAATVVTSGKVDEVQVAQVVDAAVTNEKLDQIADAVAKGP